MPFLVLCIEGGDAPCYNNMYNHSWTSQQQNQTITLLTVVRVAGIRKQNDESEIAQKQCYNISIYRSYNVHRYMYM